MIERITAVHADRQHDSQSGAPRNDLPEFKPYVYGGGDREPPAVTAARERHQALSAEIDRRRDAFQARLDELAEAARKGRDAGHGGTT